jgi:O-antigen chain-terminating methyltransferase
MIAANNPEIDVNQLLQRIREELARPLLAASPAPAAPLIPGPVNLAPPRPAEKAILPLKPVYTLRDFLDHHDEAFIVNAYWGVLRRVPDPTGLDNFLGKLRNGDYTKIEILGRLRFSPEGRRCGVHIRGLALPFAVQTASRLPVVGYGVAWLNAIARLPVFLKNWRRFEAHVALSLDQQQRVAAAGVDQIHQIHSLLEPLQREISQLAQDKAGRADLDRLQTLTDEKASRQQLADLRQRFQGDLAQVEQRLQDALTHTTAEQQAALAQARQYFEETLTHATAQQHTTLTQTQQYFQDTLNQAVAQLHDTLRDLRRQIFDQKRTLLDQQRRLGLLLEEARKRLPEPLNPEQLTNLLSEEDHLLDAMYATFEDQFRGTREDIQNRQRIYLPLIQDCQAGTDDAPVLDIGCGRGEWLALLRDEGLTARGVDLNRIFVQQCQEDQLTVIEQDAIAYLRSLPNHALGAITGFHIIEHLPTRTLIALFDEALRVLRPGGVAIFETPNPGNVLVGSCSFYMDPTHRNPLPPLLSRYLIEARGFVRVEIRELHPVDVSQHITEGPSAIIGPLNHYLFGPQDYAVIAYKA